jgi:hypothetical protein
MPAQIDGDASFHFQTVAKGSPSSEGCSLATASSMASSGRGRDSLKRVISIPLEVSEDSTPEVSTV